MMLLDTDVFIDHFRGQEAATTYIHSLPVDQRATTDITIMELYKWAANQQELATILRFSDAQSGDPAAGVDDRIAAGGRAGAPVWARPRPRDP